jgi:hypothetical protein
MRASFSHQNWSQRLANFSTAWACWKRACGIFYTRAMQLKAVGGKPDEVDANLLKAVGIAEKVMPYRHHRLAAIKLDKDPLPPGLRQDASLEELEAELKKHWLRLAPVLDLEALMAPAARKDADRPRQFPLGGPLTE